MRDDQPRYFVMSGRADAIWWTKELSAAARVGYRIHSVHHFSAFDSESVRPVEAVFVIMELDDAR